MIPLLLSLLLSSTPGVADGGIIVAKGHRFLAEVARTPQEQARGLMYRQALAKDRCMFFFYQEDGEHRIWMKNCLIALDVVWIKADGTVVETSERTPPCSPMLGDDCPVYGGTVPARDFVEFPRAPCSGSGSGRATAWAGTWSCPTGRSGGGRAGQAQGQGLGSAFLGNLGLAGLAQGRLHAAPAQAPADVDGQGEQEIDGAEGQEEVLPQDHQQAEHPQDGQGGPVAGMGLVGALLEAGEAHRRDHQDAHPEQFDGEQVGMQAGRGSWASTG